MGYSPWGGKESGTTEGLTLFSLSHSNRDPETLLQFSCIGGNEINPALLLTLLLSHFLILPRSLPNHPKALLSWIYAFPAGFSDKESACLPMQEM